MNLEPDPTDEAFRQEVRAFFREHLPPELARRFHIGAHPPERADVLAELARGPRLVLRPEDTEQAHVLKCARHA